jgi:thiamine biosynthesis lipoprotein
MATTFKVAAYTDDPKKLEEVVQAIEAEALRLNLVFSDYDPNSELERWVASKATAEFALSPELFEILCISEEWNRRSDGAFDPSVGQITRMWRKRRKAKALPTEDELRFAREHSGWQHVHIDRQTRRVRIDDPEVRIDLGGIAIGYTVDRCCNMLEKSGIHCYLLDAGGDIRCGDAPPDREGWRIEVAAIEKGGEPLQQLLVRNCAITTSGDLFRFTVINGVRHGHTIDPKTGYGVPGPMAVTVIADTCLQVDVVDNVLAIMGPERGPQFLKEHLPNAEALFVWKSATDDSNHVHETDGFATRGLKVSKDD